MDVESKPPTTRQAGQRPQARLHIRRQYPGARGLRGRAGDVLEDDGPGAFVLDDGLLANHRTVPRGTTDHKIARLRLPQREQPRTGDTQMRARIREQIGMARGRLRLHGQGLHPYGTRLPAGGTGRRLLRGERDGGLTRCLPSEFGRTLHHQSPLCVIVTTTCAGLATAPQRA